MLPHASFPDEHHPNDHVVKAPTADDPTDDHDDPRSVMAVGDIQYEHNLEVSLEDFCVERNQENEQNEQEQQRARQEEFQERIEESARGTKQAGISRNNSKTKQRKQLKRRKLDDLPATRVWSNESCSWSERKRRGDSAKSEKAKGRMTNAQGVDEKAIQAKSGAETSRSRDVGIKRSNEEDTRSRAPPKD